MIDIKLIRESPEKIKSELGKRGEKIDFTELLENDKKRKELLLKIEQLRKKRNIISEKIGTIKTKNDISSETKEDIDKISSEIEQDREKIRMYETELTEIEHKIHEFLLRIPNLPDETVPIGNSSADNRVIRYSGTIKEYGFKPKPHWELGKKLDILDFEKGVKLSCSRFVVLKGAGCKLERALINFMIDTHINRGYTEIFTPYLVNKDTITGTGQLPKFEDEIYKTTDVESVLYLIPTAEVSVTNLHRDEILSESELPKKYVSYSACFRRESGSYGKDTKGLIRNHQFNKIELVKIVKPQDSANELESLVSDAEEILKQLMLPYRVVELCTSDLGFSSSKTYDIEVWMPGEKMWREISSCSNCKDFQARRMNTKYRTTDGKKEFVHTLNGSGIAVGRTFAAILENYQNPDGTVTVPEVLIPYMKMDKII
jgi:seryl-tRNA synthetase